jgi:hypothetical protein
MDIGRRQSCEDPVSARGWLGIALLVASGLRAQEPAGFPHEKHAKLFPDCVGCHTGIITGDAAATMPAPASCAQCHNTRDAAVVKWTAAVRRPTNLRFSHVDHAVATKSTRPEETCQSCHSQGLEAAWMEVRRATSDECLTCHKAQSHLAENAECKTCHVTLTNAKTLPVSRIAAFPKPASHSRPDFAAAHAPGTPASIEQCATCHSRESCARCHPNASKLGSIAQLGADGRVAQLMKAPAYFTPVTHKRDAWPLDHGKFAAQQATGCANCHTQTSCQSCHKGANGTKAIAELAAPRKDETIGVAPTRTRVHPAGFDTQHKAAAGSGRLDCLGCHKQSECSSCHEGSGTRKYHASDFMSRHATSAYGQDQTCTSCHRTETFCRSCHQQTNAGASGTRNGAVHTAQPMWLLQHGQAARQGLNGCTSCHQQKDCLQCHSNLGWSVNPHGSGFDASKMSARNKAVCRTCHLSDPVAGKP